MNRVYPICYRFNTVVGDLDTGIGINSGIYGRTMLAICSQQTGPEDTTYSFIRMIRCGYSGNHVTETNIAGESAPGFSVAFLASSNGTLIVRQSGNVRVGYVMILANR